MFWQSLWICTVKIDVIKKFLFLFESLYMAFHAKRHYNGYYPGVFAKILQNSWNFVGNSCNLTQAVCCYVPETEQYHIWSSLLSIPQISIWRFHAKMMPALELLQWCRDIPGNTEIRGNSPEPLLIIEELLRIISEDFAGKEWVTFKGLLIRRWIIAENVAGNFQGFFG